MDPCGTPQEIFPKWESLFSMFTRNILSERCDLNHFIVFLENLMVLCFCNKISCSIVSMPSVDQLIKFQLAKLHQALLKCCLLRKTNINLLNDYLKTWYLYPKESNLFGHELHFQWYSKMMEAMRLACSQKDQFFLLFKNRFQFRNFTGIWEDSLWNGLC